MLLQRREKECFLLSGAVVDWEDEICFSRPFTVALVRRIPWRVGSRDQGEEEKLPRGASEEPLPAPVMRDMKRSEVTRSEWNSCRATDGGKRYPIDRSNKRERGPGFLFVQFFNFSFYNIVWFGWNQCHTTAAQWAFGDDLESIPRELFLVIFILTSRFWTTTYLACARPLYMAVIFTSDILL